MISLWKNNVNFREGTGKKSLLRCLGEIPVQSEHDGIGSTTTGQEIVKFPLPKWKMKDAS
jgi:hypothetical protein